MMPLFCPIISRNTQRPAVMMVPAIKTPEGELRSLLAVEMGLDHINKKVSDINTGDTSYAWIVDNTGMIFRSRARIKCHTLNLRKLFPKLKFRNSLTGKRSFAV
jgi:hypothetical protein